MPKWNEKWQQWTEDDGDDDDDDADGFDYGHIGWTTTRVQSIYPYIPLLERLEPGCVLRSRIYFEQSCRPIEFLAFLGCEADGIKKQTVLCIMSWNIIGSVAHIRINLSIYQRGYKADLDVVQKC